MQRDLVRGDADDAERVEERLAFRTAPLDEHAVGRLDVKWDPGTKVTPSGGLAYFAVFLKVTGFFDIPCSDFPVDYRSNNSSSRRDIVGTIVLAILFGKDRYVQINALRNDTASIAEFRFIDKSTRRKIDRSLSGGPPDTQDVKIAVRLTRGDFPRRPGTT